MDVQTKKSWRVERRHWRHSIGLLPLPESPDDHPQKQTVKPRDALKNENTAFQQWFENVRGCREAALHLFVNQIPPTDSWHQVDSVRCHFHAFMPALTLVSLLEKYLVLKLPCRVATSENDRLHIYSLCWQLIESDTWLISDYTKLH